MEGRGERNKATRIVRENGACGRESLKVGNLLFMPLGCRPHKWNTSYCSHLKGGEKTCQLHWNGVSIGITLDMSNDLSLGLFLKTERGSESKEGKKLKVKEMDMKK